MCSVRSLVGAQHMASVNGFIRHAPRGRLRAFLECSGIDKPEEMDWSDDQKQTKYVKAINTSIDAQMPLVQDKIRMELKNTIFPVTGKIKYFECGHP